VLLCNDWFTFSIRKIFTGVKKQKAKINVLVKIMRSLLHSESKTLIEISSVLMWLLMRENRIIFRTDMCNREKKNCIQTYANTDNTDALHRNRRIRRVEKRFAGRRRIMVIADVV